MTVKSSISLCILALCTFLQAIRAHTVITYPGWRGNNLQTNGTVVESNGLGSMATENGTIFPFGMQWQYPCGGMPMSENRTKWPVQGGAIAFQPGWFYGHHTAFMYFNLGLGNQPDNYSFVMQNGLNIIGPSAEPYPGTFCLPQVPLPAGLSFNVGDNATIQVILTAIHGAALYDCVDITFADPADVEEVTPDNCFNSSQISSSLVFTTTDLEQTNAATTPSARSATSVLAAFIVLATILAL